MREQMSKSFDLTGAFAAKQQHMLSALGMSGTYTDHPVIKGNATELHWCNLLRDFLPTRYGVGQAVAIDSRGGVSDQIDIAIYDRQYSPLFFKQNDVLFVPAESIYAVCEVKQTMTKEHLQYARDKVESVRKLHRTSVDIRHAGGTFDAQDPETKPILGVFLSTTFGWKSTSSKAAIAAILDPSPTFLNLGISVDGIAFDREQTLELAPRGQELIWFCTRLYRALTRAGSVLGIDLDAYYSSIDSPTDTSMGSKSSD
jgi:hypothetical protein